MQLYILGFNFRRGGILMKIAVIGSCMVDVTSYIDQIPVAGETREVKGFHLGCGGKGANQAIAAAKLGMDVFMLAKIGDDIFGEMTFKNFQLYNVNTKHIKAVKEVSNGIATIIVDCFSQNRILINKGANSFLVSADITNAAEDIKQCDLLILQLEINLSTVYAAIEFAVEHHIPVLLNPAPAVKKLDVAMACKCDFFVPNETELGILTGLPVNSEKEIEKAALSLVDRGFKNVIVTMGSRGSLWITKNCCEHVPAYSVDAVDTTGAGDAFIGCFADTYLKTKDILKSMKRAAAFAAMSVMKHGAQTSYPTADELELFLQKQNC